ncbi:MAG TPA: hypothetical protein VLH83_07775 [Chthoniobacterales bacterium]|nr:hypothetical protein [Chthoniobacterales bacterium]
MSLIITTAIVLGACERKDEQIKVYRIAKAPLESTPAPEALMPTNASSPSALSTAAPTALVPPNWEAQPLSQMRQASFLVHGENGAVADISFVVLGPAAGNLLDNVNRWLGQLVQAPITEEKLKGMIQPLPTARGEVAVVDLSGQPENGDATKDGRIVGAIAADANGTAFFKMRGNTTLVGAEKENFLKWIAASRASAPDSSTANTNVPPVTSDKPEIKWEVPAGWSPAPASAMRYASFAAEKNGEKADISVVTFPGEGGGDVENVNRWRQQIGLPAIGAELLKPMITSVQAADVRIDTIDMSGPSARVLAGWARQGGRAWFFKLTGPPNLVEKEKPKFVAFLQSIRL